MFRFSTQHCLQREFSFVMYNNLIINLATNYEKLLYRTIHDN